MALNDKSAKKELLAQYREREIVGCVYLVRNTLNNRLLLDYSTDVTSIRNRYEFAQKTGSCVAVKLNNDWMEHGSGAFSFEVLEELKKSETQTDAQYKADLEFLREAWREKLSNEVFY